MCGSVENNWWVNISGFFFGRHENKFPDWDVMKTTSSGVILKNLIDRHNFNIIFQEHLNDGPAIRNLNGFQFLQQLCF